MEKPAVTFVAPLLMVTDIQRSLAFYVDGLGFTVQNRWEPNGQLRWVWLSLGTAHLMLQQPNDFTKFTNKGALGNGVSFYFQTTDAISLFREFATRNIHPRHEPQVGNGNWEVFYSDPDGYAINFCSPAEAAEETLLSQTTL